MAEGDRLMARLGPDLDPDEAARQRAQAFDAWQAALLASAPGDAVPARPDPEDELAARLWPDPSGTPERLVEGVGRAVLRRLATLSPTDAAAWTQRFEDLAQDRLRAAASDADLARVERDLPATPAAVRAALLELDRALERGDRPGAATWLERCDQEAQLLERCGREGDALADERERRRGALAALEPPARAAEPWRTATQAGPVRTLVLSPGGSAGTTYAGGVRPHFARLADGRVVLQRPRSLVLLDPELGAQLGGELMLDEVLSGLAQPPARDYAGPGGNGWPLLPLAVGNDLVLVHGRSGRDAANVLLRIEAPPEIDEPGAVPVPVLRWAVQGGLLLGPGGRAEAIPELAGLPGLELQPGPVRDGPRVLVQARQWPVAQGSGPAAARGLDRIALAATGEIRAFVLAFDLDSGRLLWLRSVAKGVELGTDLGRLGGRVLQSTSAQPLALAGRALLAGTHLGTATCLSPLDGRLRWTLRGRRRSPEQSGWNGGRPPVSGHTAVWAPADGDHLYWLDLGPDPTAPVLLRPPRGIGEAEALVTADATRALVLARAGSRPALSAWDGPTGGRRDALYLEPGAPTPAALASPERVWVATPAGLHLFDRTRDDLLLWVEPIENPPAEFSVLWAEGDRVLALGSPERGGFRRLWVFSARP